MERKICNDTLKQSVIINGGILHTNKNLRNLSFLISYFILLTIVTKLVHRLQKSVAFECENHASIHVNIVLANGFSQCF